MPGKNPDPQAAQKRQKICEIAATYANAHAGMPAGAHPITETGKNTGPTLTQYLKGRCSFRDGDAWCAHFISMCFEETENKISGKPYTTSKINDLFPFASAAAAKTRVFSPNCIDAKPGTGFVRPRNGGSGHVALIVKNDTASKTLYTIEGNCSDKCQWVKYTYASCESRWKNTKKSGPWGIWWLWPEDDSSLSTTINPDYSGKDQGGTPGASTTSNSGSYDSNSTRSEVQVLDANCGLFVASGSPDLSNIKYSAITQSTGDGSSGDGSVHNDQLGVSQTGSGNDFDIYNSKDSGGSIGPYTGEPQSINWDNAKICWKYFKAKGYSDLIVAGILGNFAAESSIIPTAMESGEKSGGIGIGQWTGLKHKGRRAAFQDWCKENGKDRLSLQTQLEYWDHEPSNVRSYLNFCKSQPPKNPEQAARVFERTWEISGDVKGSSTQAYNNTVSIIVPGQYKRRQDSAAEIYQKFHGTT